MRLNVGDAEVHHEDGKSDIGHFRFVVRHDVASAGAGQVQYEIDRGDEQLHLGVNVVSLMNYDNTV